MRLIYKMLILAFMLSLALSCHDKDDMRHDIIEVPSQQSENTSKGDTDDGDDDQTEQEQNEDKEDSATDDDSSDNSKEEGSDADSSIENESDKTEDNTDSTSGMEDGQDKTGQDNSESANQNDDSSEAEQSGTESSPSDKSKETEGGENDSSTMTDGKESESDDSSKSEENTEPSSFDETDGKRISIVGNSICTFSDYIHGNRTYYPRADVKTVDQTWWMMIINRLGGVFHQNYSYSGGKVTSTSTNHPSLLYQINRLEPTDILLLCGGINDANTNTEIGDYHFEKKTDDLSELLFAEAYDKYVRIGIEKSKEVICFIMAKTSDPYAEVIQNVASHYGLTCVDLREIQGKIKYINKSVHPSLAGMQAIAEYCCQMIDFE